MSVAAAKKEQLKGAVVFHVDVGHLSPDKAEGVIVRLQEKNADFLNSLPKDVGVVWLPVRNGNTRVEYLSLK